uniref:Tabserin n=1 Tax=Tabanus yao TaxID=485572 RepID=SER_TABYA|nr:RecName: Full=Tabserin; Flags: Precursor [Tabanus yao]ABX80068.1 tabserin [Tabanus yao]
MLKYSALFLYLIYVGGSESAHSRIVGGVPVAEEKVPYVVSIRMKEIHVCGGSILSESIVLTAAHCFDKSKGYSNYAVFAGSNRLSGGLKVEIQNITIHPKYIGPSDWWKNDLAVVKLKKPLNFSKSVRTVKIFPSYVPENETVYAYGWGKTIVPFFTLPNVLQKLETKALNLTACQKSWKEHVVESQLCLWTGHGTGVGLCKADSGGPVVYKGKLVGVISWVQVHCNTKKPDVAVRLSPYFENGLRKR